VYAGAISVTQSMTIKADGGGERDDQQQRRQRDVHLADGYADLQPAGWDLRPAAVGVHL